jgi:hypothetical protein
MKRTRAPWLGSFLLCLCLCLPVQAEKLPAIFLERVSTDSGLAAASLKQTYESCVAEKKLLQKIKREMGENSIAWEAAIETYEREVISNVDFDAFAEPDWKQLTQKRTQEYFDQEKYASRIYKSHYQIDRARCKLVERKDLTIRIDDGSREVIIDFKDELPNIASGIGVDQAPNAAHYKSYKVRQRPSPRVVRDELLAEIKALRNSPEAVGALGEVTSLPGDRAPRTGGMRLPGIDERQVLENSLGFEQDNYSEHNGGPGAPLQDAEQLIAGQACDMTRLKGMGAKVCLWHKMNRYPDEYGALVLLLKESRLGNYVLRDEAKKFRIQESIDQKFYELPSGVRLR